MPSRYNFGSVGAAGYNAIEEFLVKRALEEREQAATAHKQRQDQEAADRAQQQLMLQAEQERRIAEAQKNAQADLEQEREFRRATTIVDNSLPNDQVDEATASLLTKQGYGGAMTRTQPTQGAHLGVDEAGIDQYAVVPGILQMRGGSKYLTAQAGREAQAAAAEAARTAAAERARESSETRLAIAQMGADSRAAALAAQAETNTLRNDLLRRDVQKADQEAADKAEAKKRAADARRLTATSTIEVLKELADFDQSGRATLKPGTRNLYGARIPGAAYFPGETSKAESAMNRLKGRVIVDLLNEMKNQSATGATGFGALSGPELRLLENAASELNSSLIPDDRVADELERIYKAATQLYGGQAVPTSTAANDPLGIR